MLRHEPATDTNAASATADELRIPIIEEVARVSKRAVPLEHVAVHTRIEKHEVVVRDQVRREEIDVTRVAIDREVAEAPQVRTEGDITIVPILEERLVVEKRQFLVEELHLTRRTSTEQVALPTTLRRTRVDVERHVLQQEEI